MIISNFFKAFTKLRSIDRKICNSFGTIENIIYPKYLYTLHSACTHFELVISKRAQQIR